MVRGESGQGGPRLRDAAHLEVVGEEKVVYAQKRELRQEQVTGAGH